MRFPSNFSDTSHRAERVKNALKTVASGIGARAVTSLVNLISLPLTVGYLGRDRFGVWVTISTTMAWLNMLDFGLGLGLTNVVADAKGRDDEGEIGRALSSAIAISALIAIPCGALIIALSYSVDIARVLNLAAAASTSEVRNVCVASGFLVLANMVTGVIPAAARAMQRGQWANYASTGASLATCGGIVWAAHVKASLPWLAAISAAPVSLAWLALGAYMGLREHRYRPRWSFVSTSMSKRLMSTGTHFFLIQLASVAVFQADAIIIAKNVGPGEVTPFSIATRIMGLGTFLVGTYLGALWPAFGEAWARKDWNWVSQVHNATRWLSTGLMTVVAIGFVTLGPVVIPLFIGEAARGTFTLYAWIALQAVIRAWTDAHAYVLNGINQTREQMFSAVIHAGVSLALSIYLAQAFGAVGVAAGNALGYAFVSAWFLPLVVRRALQAKLSAGAASEAALG